MMLSGHTLAVLLTLLTAAATGVPATASPVALPGVVLAWSDGDTVRVRVGASTARVRLIGIDAPETSPGARAARQGQQLGRDAITIAALGRQALEAARRLVRVQQEARAAGRGLWRPW